MRRRSCCCMYLYIILSAISVACSASSSSSKGNHEQDEMALLVLRDGFIAGGTPPDGSALNSWNASLHFCQWEGVTCGKRHKRITAIELVKQKLDGLLSPSLGNLTFLKRLDLTNNTLHGKIPQEIGQLRRLQYLNLRGNSFQGIIPVELSNCSSLISVHLSGNNFTGQIPFQFGSLLKIELFRVDRNNLVGVMPTLFRNFSSLRLLHLGHNHFHGEIRDSLHGLSKMTALSLSTNYFSGMISPLYNLSSLEELEIISNHFTGTLAQDMDVAFPKLTFLSFADNNFTGTIPSSLSNISRLTFCLMNKNRFTGRVPNNLGKLNSLTHLQLAGEIPSSIGKLSNIHQLIVAGNNLHGGIPSSINNLTNLFSLDLSKNSLNGVIPAALGNSTKLQVINISSNHLSGNLPDDIFSSFRDLRSCDMSHNYFHGTFPSLVGELINLNMLNASHNNFSGEIPAQLGESLGLEFLIMADNSFKGSIPPSLGSLKGLRWLDLSKNNLSGPIPKELAGLVGLQNLNLSFNQLEGEIPLFKNFTEVSIIGNNGLCSRNLELKLQPCMFHTKGKSISISIVIAITLSVVTSFTLLLILSIIVIRRRRKHIKDSADGLGNEYQRVTYAELFRATEGFTESNLIGRGSFGEVYRGILDEDDRKSIAVKVLNLSKHGAAKSFKAECKVLRSIRHRNLLRIITSCSSLDHKGNDFKALVLDFMSNGNLDDWLHFSDKQRETRVLTLARRLEIGIDVGCALDYLHNGCQTPIVHCDLKPSNILLDEDMVAHVGDFGLAKLLCGVTENFSGGESLSTSIKGSIGYVAPEYGMGGAISAQGDIYSYGIVLLELITGKRPTDDLFNNDMSLRNFIERAIPNHVEEIIDQHLVNELQEATAAHRYPEQFKLQWHAFLISFVEVGISCSAEYLRDRMDIQSAIRCLTVIKGKYNSILTEA